jgi:RNA polymerase sigma-70 factor (ECF subfamily)
MRLWEKRNEITPTNLSGLLFQMVRNECLNHIKHQYIASTESIDDLLANTGSEALYWQDMAPDADARLLQQDLEAHINEALMHISDKARELFLLSRNEGLSPKELAERYDISRQAVEKHIHAAIDALKKYLPKEYLWVALLYITLFTQ